MTKRSAGHWTKGRICVLCGSSENLSRHHLKNKVGMKTGKIQILCRNCHNKAENDYETLGIVGTVPISKNEKLQLDYMNGLIPYYSVNGVKQ